MQRKTFVIKNHYAGIYHDAQAHWVYLHATKITVYGWEMIGEGDAFALVCFTEFLKNNQSI